MAHNALSEKIAKIIFYYTIFMPLLQIAHYISEMHTTSLSRFTICILTMYITRHPECFKRLSLMIKIARIDADIGSKQNLDAVK